LFYRILTAKSLISGGIFFIAVFISGLLWAAAKVGGLADAFILQSLLK
jgi:hypothetical protein